MGPTFFKCFLFMKLDRRYQFGFFSAPYVYSVSATGSKCANVIDRKTFECENRAAVVQQCIVYHIKIVLCYNNRPNRTTHKNRYMRGTTLHCNASIVNASTWRFYRFIIHAWCPGVVWRRTAWLRNATHRIRCERTLKLSALISIDLGLWVRWNSSQCLQFPSSTINVKIVSALTTVWEISSTSSTD